MRSISLALGIIVVGILAALPFRRTPSTFDSNDSAVYSSGSVGGQLRSSLVDEVVQWPDRPGFDPSLAWQPHPMTLDGSPRKIEMPPMPADFPKIDIETLTPVRAQSRFDAASSLSIGASAPSLLKSSDAQIKDRFTYSPPPELPKANRPSAIQPASVISRQPVTDLPATERQYIREPK